MTCIFGPVESWDLEKRIKINNSKLPNQQKFHNKNPTQDFIGKILLLTYYSKPNSYF